MLGVTRPSLSRGLEPRRRELGRVGQERRWLPGSAVKAAVDLRAARGNRATARSQAHIDEHSLKFDELDGAIEFKRDTRQAVELAD